MGTMAKPFQPDRLETGLHIPIDPRQQIAPVTLCQILRRHQASPEVMDRSRGESGPFNRHHRRDIDAGADHHGIASRLQQDSTDLATPGQNIIRPFQAHFLPGKPRRQFRADGKRGDKGQAEKGLWRNRRPQQNRQIHAATCRRPGSAATPASGRLLANQEGGTGDGPVGSRLPGKVGRG